MQFLGRFLGGVGAVVENMTTNPDVRGAITPAAVQTAPETLPTEVAAPDKTSINLVSAVAEELGMNVRFFR